MLFDMTAVNPHRTRTPRAEVRERILQAAKSVFASYGFAGATIDAIAGVAGFTKGAVYSNFGSKDDLFFVLLDEQIAHRRDAVAALLGAAGGRPTFQAVGDLLMRELLDNQNWQILFTEYWLRAMRDPQVRQRFVEHRRAVRAAVEDAVRRLDQWSGVEPKYAAILLLALNSGLSIEEFTEPGTVPRDMLGSVIEAVAAAAGYCR
jgi:AcrR family transcriptional regulator